MSTARVPHFESLAPLQLSTLATALGAANLVNVLEGPGPFTVLAPNNNVSCVLPSLRC